MPSRSPSYSPDTRVMKKKHKHRSRSRSPHEYDEQRSKHRNRNTEDHLSRHHGHKKHKHKHRRSRSSSFEEEESRHRVKKERHDRGYDKYDTVPSRWENEDDHSRRPVKQEQHSDSESDDDRHSRHRRSVKHEPDSEDDNQDRRHRNHRGRRDRHRDERERIQREDQQERRHHDQRRRDKRNRHGGNPFEASEEDNFQFGRQGDDGGASSSAPPEDKEKPNLEVSGKLTEDTNTFKGVVIKYNEPPEARKPKRRWRLYPFKGDEALPVLHIHRQSAYLLGRDRRIADIPVDHPSCSKQHAVLQYRAVPFTREDGSEGRRCRPYVIDLGSANGTFVNNQRIDTQRYVELIEKDVVKFGFSSREYVILTDKADTSELSPEAEGGHSGGHS